MNRYLSQVPSKLMQKDIYLKDLNPMPTVISVKSNDNASQSNQSYIQNKYENISNAQHDRYQYANAGYLQKYFDTDSNSYSPFTPCTEVKQFGVPEVIQKLSFH